MNLSRLFAILKTVRRDLVVDAVGIIGFGLVLTGLWWIYPPAAIILTGLVVAGVARQFSR